ncbi:hypothetical protein QA646_05680 [Rhizobium sp. CB3090]|uniref:hypothetical protein n=1 Tax=Rhizobium sp. CB3090 TaxID=3039156 RepID=UPI0024B10C2E|nr:hypothetical protein [Rhizobium sp. CB3090]WFU10348.1 hypothetical protein QA646_05680 [Rhizobium sp. CB3090]
MRKKRSEMFTSLEVLHWLDEDGNPVADVEDRFNSRYVYYNHSLGESFACKDTIAETGVGIFSLQDVLTLGFTTEEYNAMMRYFFENNREECISSEEELNELMQPNCGTGLRR